MTRAGNSFQTDASPVRVDRAGSEGASSRVMASRAARLGSQMGASTVGLPRGRLCLIWCGRGPKAACGRACSPVEAYIALASPRSRAARRDSGRARLPRLPEAKFIQFYYLQGPRERLDERAPAGATAGPQLSDRGLCGAPISFWQAIAWRGRVSRARSARPFPALIPRLAMNMGEDSLPRVRKYVNHPIEAPLDERPATMTKHSKNNTASSVFSYAEYKKLDYGTKRVSPRC